MKTPFARARRASVWVSLLIALSSCKAPPPAETLSARPLVVATSTYPLYWMASTLAGSHAEVFLAPPAEVDPAHWAPDDAAIQRLQAADRVVINGAGFEAWVGTTSLPVSRVVDTTAGLKAQLRSGRGHHHGPGDGHAVDPHVWLDPTLAQAQLAVLVTLLKGRVPDDALAKRGNGLRSALAQISYSLKRLGEIADDQVFLANHRAYDYLAARARIRVHSLDLSPQAPAAEAEPVCIVARRLKARHMLWEAAPAPALAAALRACKVESHVLRPLETPPPEGSYHRAHQSDLAKLMKALADK